METTYVRDVERRGRVAMAESEPGRHPRSVVFEWVLFPWDLSFRLWFSVFKKETRHVVLSLGLLFLKIHVEVTGFNWWTAAKEKDPFSREVSFSFRWPFFNAVLFCDPHVKRQRDRRYSVDVVSVLFGPVQERSATPMDRQAVYIILPEGYYLGYITMTEVSVIRPRSLWPFPKRMKRGEISIPGGIPIPGSSLEDALVGKFSCVANTIPEAIKRLSFFVLEKRANRSDLQWRPLGGWPDHCYEQRD